MNAIVEYQLQRAATAGYESGTGLLHVKQVHDRTLGSLQKVYRDKAITLNVSVSDGRSFKRDEGD